MNLRRRLRGLEAHVAQRRSSTSPIGRIAVNSLPKSGTTLVRKALLSLPGTVAAPRALTSQSVRPARSGSPSVLVGVDRPVAASIGSVRRRLHAGPAGSVVIGHWPWSTQMAALLDQHHIVVVLRDPRAVARSLAQYVVGEPDHFLHREFTDMSAHDRILAAIEGFGAGDNRLLDLADRYRSVLAWQADPRALMVRFEDLVGPEGGGSLDRQIAALRGIVDHVQAPLTDAEIATLAVSLFGGTSTFRRGQIGGWRDEFSPAHHAAAERVLGDVLDEAGYA